MQQIKVGLLAGVLSVTALSAQPSSPLGGMAGEWAKALNARDAAKLMTFYADDSVIMPPNEPIIKGRQNVEGWINNLIGTDLSNVQLTPLETSTSGDFGYVAGTYSLTVGADVDRGKYVEVWKRTGGQWKIAYEIYNSDLPTMR